MRHKSEQFTYEVEKAAKKEQRESTWPVYKEYETVREGARLYLHAPRREPERPSRRGGHVRFGDPDLNLDREYAPLREATDLFLRFALLAPQHSLPEEAWLEIMLSWVGKYGTLGSHTVGDIRPVDRPNTLGAAPDPRRVQSLSEFCKAVHEARYCLSLYEAAKAHQAQALAKVLDDHGRRNKTLDQQRDVASSQAMMIVDSHVRSECYPSLFRRNTSGAYESSEIAQGWGFRSLLGAMYLQMMWVMTGGSAARLCQGPGCSNIITFDLPEGSTQPANQKRTLTRRARRDKVFCSRNCKEKRRYHHVIKPQQQAK